MLDKNKLIYLNQNCKYKEIYKIFSEEYISVISKFLDKKGIDYIKAAPISYYIEILSKNYIDEMEDVIDMLINIFEDEDEILEDKIYMAIDAYNHISERLK